MTNESSLNLDHVMESSRDIFEHLLVASLGHCKTRHTCLYASVLLLSFVQKFTSTASSWISGGGEQESDNGYGLVGQDGVWHGHYWVEGVDGGLAFIADIAADQFGYPVIVLAHEGSHSFPEIRARYRPDPTQGVVARTADEGLRLLVLHARA